MQQGQAEGGRLAGAGLGLAEQVAAEQQIGDGGLLDRGGIPEADADQTLEQVGPQAEIGETIGLNIADQGLARLDLADCGFGGAGGTGGAQGIDGAGGAAG